MKTYRQIIISLAIAAMPAGAYADKRDHGKHKGHYKQGHHVQVADRYAPAGRQGRVIARACPFKCATQGLPKSVCRDWREGNTCYIEDLRYPPGGPGYAPPPLAYRDDCRNLRASEMPDPRVDIHRVRESGSYYSDRFRVSGHVEGRCLAEAGYFEDGRKIRDIPINTTTSYDRFEFDIETRSARDPEIRVYNTRGEREIYSLDREIDSGRARYRGSPWWW